MTGFSNKFLQDKINELQSALFFPESDSVLKMPVHVISIVEADEEGQIWFTIPKPSQELKAFEREFPSKLDFSRKGKCFYIKIQGLASIVQSDVADGTNMPSQVKQSLLNPGLVAIKVKVQTADYFENVPKTSSNWFQISTNYFMNWLLNPKYNHQNPQLITIPINLE
jgi:general stress protein 26